MNQLPIQGKGTLKELIVSQLIEEALTSRQMVGTIIAQKNVSAQAIYKALTQLEKDKVIRRQGTIYLIHPQWIESMQLLLNKVGQTTAGLQPRKKPDIRTFDTITDLGRFLIFDFCHYPNPEKQRGVARWKFMYSLIGLSKEEIAEVRKQFKNQKWTILCGSKTIVDHFFKKTYEKMGARVKLGMPWKENYDLMVVGDHLCEIHYEAKTVAQWKADWGKPKTIKEFNLERLLQRMHEPTICKTIIYYDQKRAKKEREKIELAWKTA